MFKTSIKLDPIFEEKFKSVRKETAEVIVAMVEAEFVDLLYNAPQFTGTFVANMAVRSGTYGAGSRAIKEFPEIKDGKQAYARGQLPAIQHALGQNANLKKNLTHHITQSSGWLTGLTVYNRLLDAEEIEGLGVSELRDINRPGVHSMAKFGVNLQSRLNTSITWGDSNWYKYLGSTYT